ncbi:MAG: PqqD family protein [Acidobacteriota bacterium]
MTGNPQDRAPSAEALATRVFRRNPTVSFTRFGEEGLLVVPKASWNMVLNGAGARAFELIDGVRTIGSVAQAIFEEFDAPSLGEVEADLAELVADLCGRGALEEVLN